MTDEERKFLLSLFDFDKKLTDSQKIKKIYSISNNTDKYYKTIEIRKRNNKIRKVYNPNYYLKNIQRRILKNILYDKKTSTVAMAYCKNRSIKDNAMPHTNKNIIVKLDIKDFFNNITFSNVYAIFNSFGYSKRISSLLTYLTTYYDFLPQGAPTSSYISNLILRDFDYEIDNWCKNNNISYTRYSDDMTFSMDEYNKNIIPIVRKKLYKIGLDLNDEKTHIIRKSNKQIVTGIVTNQKIQTDIIYRKKIRQELFYINKFGLESHLKKINYNDTKEEYLYSLLGRINYVLFVNSNKEFEKYKEIVLYLLY